MFGNPDLKPETSTNYEVSALWSNRDDLSGGVTLFYNDFQDKLSTVTTDQRWNGYAVMERVNVDKADHPGRRAQRPMGYQRQRAAQGQLHLHRFRAEKRRQQGARIGFTPKQKANVRTEWSINVPHPGLGVAEFYGEENRQHHHRRTRTGLHHRRPGQLLDVSDSLTLERLPQQPHRQAFGR